MLNLHFEAAARRREREVRDRLSTAWHVEFFQRQRLLKPLSHYLETDKPAPIRRRTSMPAAELDLVMRRWRAVMAVVEAQKPVPSAARRARRARSKP